MKKIAFSLACLCILVACESNVPVVEKITSTKSKIQFTSLANKDTLHISSNVSWSASVDADWVSVEPSSWSGDTIVTIKFLGNAAAPAATKITFATSSKTVEVSIERVAEYEKHNGIGRFTVAQGKTITFAPGNLRFSPKTKNWSFANEQYSYLGSANSAFADADMLDIFCWGSGDNPLYVHQRKANEYVDWGVNEIDDYPANTWRGLSSGEYYYLRKERPNAEKLFAFGNVAGRGGMFIFPDNLTCLAGISLKPSIDYSIGRDWAGGYERTNHTSMYKDNSFTMEQWKIMENAGVVFLPAAGSFEAWYNPWHFAVVDCGYAGNYWHSSEYYGGNAYGSSIEFRTDYMYFNGHKDKMWGCSVRLVKFQ